MAIEYIRLSPQELWYGKKSFLEAQLSLLNATKHFYAYKKLRKEEFMLKLALKKSAEDALSSVNLLQSILPKTTMKEEKHHVKGTVHNISSAIDEKSLSLDQEIEHIKQKLTAIR